ncbi:MAG TPA: MFS transporter [Chloroflexia bacterium]
MQSREVTPLEEPASTTSSARFNAAQFGLLVVLTAFIGGMVGLERSVLPLIARSDFGISSLSAAVAFISTFGVSKAVLNLFAGAIADRISRRACLIFGWVVGLPVPLIVMLAPDWWWVLLANVLLGINQALTWSMTLNMKLDLAGERRRGLATGLNEFAGYFGVSLLAFGTAAVARDYGLRPAPFVIGVALAVVGLLLSLFVKDTRAILQTRQRQAGQAGQAGQARPRNEATTATRLPHLWEMLKLGTWTHSSLQMASLAGLVTNLKDGMLWGLLPIFLQSRSLAVSDVGLVVAIYPAVWGIAQLGTGPLSDRIGRKALIVLGVILQGLGVASFLWFDTFPGWAGAAALVGLGTAMVYPTLQAFVSDVTALSWRASALGVYRFWRDMGYAVGALGAGVVADTLGIGQAFTLFAVLAVVTGAIFSLRVQNDLAARKSSSYSEQPGVIPQPNPNPATATSQDRPN